MDFFSPKSGIKVGERQFKAVTQQRHCTTSLSERREREEGCEESSQQQDFTNLDAPRVRLSPMNVCPGEKQSGEALR